MDGCVLMVARASAVTRQRPRVPREDGWPQDADGEARQLPDLTGGSGMIGGRVT